MEALVYLVLLFCLVEGLVCFFKNGNKLNDYVGVPVLVAFLLAFLWISFKLVVVASYSF